MPRPVRPQRKFPDSGRIADLARQSRQNALLAAIAADIVLARPVAETLQRIASLVPAATAAVAASISLLDVSRQRISMVAGEGLPAELLERDRGADIGSLPESERLFTLGKTALLTHLSDAPAMEGELGAYCRAFAATAIGSIAIVPLRLRAETIGTLNAYYRAETGPPAAEVGLLEAVANQVAMATENARLFRSAERGERHNAALAAALASATVDQSPRAVLDAIAEAVVAATNAEACGIFSVDAERIRMSGGAGLPAAFFDASDGLGDGPITVAALRATRRPLVIRAGARLRLLATPAYAAVHHFLREMTWDTLVVAPIAYRGHPIGGLNALYAPGVFPDGEEQTLLQAFANQAAVAITNLRLFEEAARSARENAALAAIAANITLGQPLRETLDAVAANIISATDGITCTISITDPSTGELTFAGAAGLPPRFMEFAGPLAERPGSQRNLAMSSGRALVSHSAKEQILSNESFRPLHAILADASWDTVVTIPIAYGNHPIGAIQVGYRGAAEPSANDWRLLDAIGDQLAVAVENARLFRASEQTARENSVLADIAASVALDQPIRETLNAIAANVVRASGAVAASIHLVDFETDTVRMSGGAGFPPLLIDATETLSASAIVFGEGIATGEDVLIPNGRELLLSNPAWAPFRDYLESAEWDAALCLPIVYRGRPLGVLQSVFRRGGTVSAETRTLLRAVTGQVALAAENLGLFDQAGARVAELEALAAISASLTVVQPLQTTLDNIAATVVSVTRCVGAAVLLRGTPATVEVAAAHGIERGFADLAKAAFASGRLSGPVQAAMESEDDIMVLERDRAGGLSNPGDGDLRDLIVGGPFAAVVLVRLRYQGRNLGRLIGFLPRGQGARPRDIDLLRAIADQAAVAIENARLFEESRQRVAELEAVSAIAASLTRMEPLASTLDALAARITSVTPLVACALTLIDGEGRARLVAGDGLPVGYIERLNESGAPFMFERTRPALEHDVVVIEDFRRRLMEDPLLGGVQDLWIGVDWETAIFSGIRYEGKMIGVLGGYLPAGVAATPQLTDLLRAAADQAAVAIESVRVFEESGRRVAELEALSSIAASLTFVQPLQTTLKTLVERVVAVTECLTCTVRVHDARGEGQLVAQSGLPPEWLEVVQGTADRRASWAPAMHAALNLDGVFVLADAPRRMLAEPAYASVHHLLGDVPWETLAIVPLRYQGRTLGQLSGSFRRGFKPGRRDLDLLRAIADQAAVATESARHYSEAQQRARESQALADIAASITVDQSIRATLDTISRGVVSASSAVASSVFLVDMASDRITAAGGTGVEPGLLDGIEQSVPASRAFSIETLQAHQTIFSPDARADMAADPAFARIAPFLRAAQWEGVMVAPMLYRGVPLGTVNAAFPAGVSPAPHEEALVKAIANQAAIAVQNLKLFTEAEGRAHQLAALYRADEELHRSLKLEDVLQALLHLVVDTLAADDAALILWERGTPRPELLTALPHPAAQRERVIASLITHRDATAIGRTAHHPLRVHAIEDTTAQSPAFRERTADVGIRSVLETVVVVDGEIFGFLSALYRKPRAFEQADTRLFGALARRASLAIENARLYEQAQTLAAVEERQRLARELHDSISQALYGVALGSRTARTLLDRDPQKAIEPVEYVLSLAEAGLAEMRALIFELRPESLAMEGLVAAIEKQMASTRARYGVAVEAQICAEPDVPLGVKEAFYRVAQEALHNVVKHARATRADLSLHYAEGVLTLDLRDDGQGFDPSGDFPGHLGLRSMRERITKLGGTLTIESAPGEGARLRASVAVVGAPTAYAG